MKNLIFLIIILALIDLGGSYAIHLANRYAEAVLERGRVLQRAAIWEVAIKNNP